METLNVSSDRQVLREVQVGADVRICNFVNAYECEIGDGSVIGTFVEIQANVRIGRRCHVSSHSCLCEGVTLEDEVFIGHGVVFVNDNRPSGRPSHWDDWKLLPVLVKTGAAIGSGSVVMGGVTIGHDAVVGAGAVVTRDVPDGAVHAGVPARLLASQDPGRASVLFPGTSK